MQGRLIERKTISITGKRQITIPQKFFDTLGFGKEAECILRNNEVVIRPLREDAGGEFAEQILEDLIKEGYSGDALLQEFKKRQKQVRPAMEKLLLEAAQAARGKGESSTIEDVFGEAE